jgi:hypothetical protein
MTIDDPAIAGLVVKVADAVPEIEQAARLLHDAYVGRDLIPPHRSGLRVTPHLVLPSTVTLVAKNGHEVVGTLSVVVDSALGLPMEKIFAGELRALRTQGRRLAELGGLCLAPKHRRTGLVILLYRLAVRVSRRALARDDLVFSIHPDAEDVYRSWFLSERIGTARTYPGLNAAALGVAMRFDVRRSRSRMHAAFRHLPLGNGNPYDLFFRRHYSQIQWPDEERLLEKIRLPRLQAAAKLLPLCPDLLADLDSASLVALEAQLPKVNLRALAAISASQREVGVGG